MQRDWDNEGAELTAEELKEFEKFYSVGKDEVATREKLEALKLAMQVYYSNDPSRHMKIKIPWRVYKSNVDVNAEKAEYVRGWTQVLREKLEESMHEMVAKFKEWSLNAHGLNIPGADAEEILHHYTLARDKCSDFVGRKSLVNKCMRAVWWFNRTNWFKEARFSGICLAIVGVSGAGKTALMAKLAQICSETMDMPVIIRFCGTSRGSNTGFSLVRSICIQILFLYEQGELKYSGKLDDDITQKLSYEAIPTTFKEMVSYFHFLLAHFVCILYIDSLDQLSNDDMARKNVSFLDGVKPHWRTRIICLLYTSDAADD